jgi:putative hydrolase
MTLGEAMPVRCHAMSGPSPDDPFSGIPFLGDLMKMLGAAGGFQWGQSVQIAMQLATDGRPEDNPDPLERIALEQLARVAELQVGRVTGLPTSVTGRPISVVPVTRGMWIQRSAATYQPLFEQLAGALASGARPGPGEAPDDPADLAGDPMAAMWGNVLDAMAPMMLSMTAGSLLGHLARRSLGQYDLPVPRPPSDELLLVAPNVAEFGEAWSLPADDLRLWVCVHEVAHHTVLSVPHVGATVRTLLQEYAAGFTPDARGLSERLGDVSFDDPSALAAMQETFGDPQVLLGALRSDAQRQLLPRLEALVALVVGVVDWVMDEVGGTVIGSYGQLSEALRRRRVEADASDRFVEQLLGLELTQAAYDRGAAFVAGVLERAGTEGLERLWVDERHLPTPAEVDAPGLWLARIDLPA